jgi:hypothetical protein
MAFIILKLCGVINWQWRTILEVLFIPILLIILLTLVVAGLIAVVEFLDN